MVQLITKNRSLLLPHFIKKIVNKVKSTTYFGILGELQAQIKSNKIHTQYTQNQKKIQ